jgi:hypothetical protein
LATTRAEQYLYFVLCLPHHVPLSGSPSPGPGCLFSSSRLTRAISSASGPVGALQQHPPTTAHHRPHSRTVCSQRRS